jgi:hypothetical protein
MSVKIPATIKVNETMPLTKNAIKKIAMEYSTTPKSAAKPLTDFRQLNLPPMPSSAKSMGPPKNSLRGLLPPPKEPSNSLSLYRSPPTDTSSNLRKDSRGDTTKSSYYVDSDNKDYDKGIIDDLKHDDHKKNTTITANMINTAIINGVKEGIKKHLNKQYTSKISDELKNDLSTRYKPIIIDDGLITRNKLTELHIKIIQLFNENILNLYVLCESLHMLDFFLEDFLITSTDSKSSKNDHETYFVNLTNSIRFTDSSIYDQIREKITSGIQKGTIDISYLRTLRDSIKCAIYIIKLQNALGFNSK